MTKQEQKNKYFDNKILKSKKPIERIGDYINNTTPILVKHTNCGNSFNIIPHHYFDTNTKLICKWCESSKYTTIEQFQWKIDNVFPHTKGKNIKVLSYSKTHGLNTYLHEDCGHIWETTHLKQCPNCLTVGRNKKLTIEEMYERMQLSRPDDAHEYVIMEMYPENTPAQHNIKLKHQCGHIWTLNHTNFISKNTRCPICAKKGKSRLEDCVVTYLIENKILFFNNISIPNSGCKNIRTLRFDIIINNKMMLIELDGVQHFKISKTSNWKNLEYNKKLDLIKNRWVSDNPEYKLLRIPYKINNSELKTILSEIINTNNLSATTIEKYKLMYIENGNTINPDYFNINQ